MTTSKDDDSYSAVEMRLELKKKRLSRIMKKLRYERRHSIMSSSKKNNKEKRLIRYCGPFSDSSGKKFFLPREWHKTPIVIGHGKKKKKGGGNEWKESKVNYVFDNEMSVTCLIKRLNWIGRTNNLMGNFLTTTTQNGNDDDDDDDDDDNDDNDGRSGGDGDEDQYVSPSLLTMKKRRTRSSGGLLLGKGVKRKRRRDEEETTMMDEHELRRAFPEMSNTLSNWTLHRQNLGSMLSIYRSQSRNMKRNQRH